MSTADMKQVTISKQMKRNGVNNDVICENQKNISKLKCIDKQKDKQSWQMKETRRSPSPYGINRYNVKNKDKQIIDALKRENQQLKRQIVDLKICQFYQFDTERLKLLISEVESLRINIRFYEEKVEKLMIEKDFLERANRKLKQERQIKAYQTLGDRRDTVAKFSNYLYDLPEPVFTNKVIVDQTIGISDNSTPKKKRNQSPDRYFRKVNSACRFHTNYMGFNKGLDTNN